MKGVVAIFISKDGIVIENEAEFDEISFGGFSLLESQKIRTKNRLKRKCIDSCFPKSIAGILSERACEIIFRDMLNNGARIEYVTVGHDDPS